MKSIPLLVNIPEYGTIEVQGWMYVLAFALKGIPWAIEEAMKPEFQSTVKEYLKDQHNYKIQKSIDYHFKRIEELKKEIHGPK